MEKFSLKEKIYQMFILGADTDEISSDLNLAHALHNNLGGVIFFTQNINSQEGIKKFILQIKKEAVTPPFLCIDQEGGRVERTLNLFGGSKYLSAKESCEKGLEFVKKQTGQIACELRDLGFNMNFAPVLDVNTNPHNPVINDRSFSSDANKVIECAWAAVETYLNKGIIPVGKHFPGHGETCADSHKTLPVVKLSFDELERVHIKPFDALIKKGLSAIMASHVHYSAFDKEPLPASVSKNVLERYLRNKLHFEGLIISDDMVMGAVKGYTPIEACIKGIEAGVNMFIYRNSDDKTLKIIDELVSLAEKNKIDRSKIDFSVQKILSLKSNAGLI